VMEGARTASHATRPRGPLGSARAGR
jgi:hypothetical protein